MRAVLLSIAHGYGSTGRLLAVARELKRRGHEPLFAVAERLEPVINQYGFDTVPISSVTADEHSPVDPVVQILTQESSDGFLERQVGDVRGVIRDYRADVVIFSQNMSAALAAAAENKPSVSIFHPTIMQFNDWPTAWALFKAWRRFADVKHAINPPKEVTSTILGDLNFIPSIPPLVYWPFVQPLEIYFRKVPVKTVGALLRLRPEELPSQDELRAEFGVGSDPFVYATIGGAIANPEFLRKVVSGLRDSGCRGLVTAGASATEELMAEVSDERVKVMRFLPQPMKAIKACDLMVWHGGHETMLESVAAGRPAVGIPYQYDQFHNVELLTKEGACVPVDKEKLSRESLAAAVRRVLSDRSFGANARRLKAINDSLGGVGRVVDSVEELLKTGRQV